ncbi:major capsid protein, partial [Escherichia coli]|uniref:major capsid protein n=1 Tax=Escherichia coli TaxID=562 RepID=UPI0039FD4181
KIVFTKDLVANSAVVADQWKHLTIDRKVFCNAEAELAKTYGVNATALVTKDYWRDVDNVTTRVFRNEAGQDMMADLMGIAANINIGKTVAISRIASDAGKVVRTLSGQEPEDLDKTRYDYTGDVIPIFKTGYSREWRELLGMQSEGFDPLLDDQANVTFNLRSDMAQYLLTGDQTLNVNGVYTGYGITNHPNTIQVNLSTDSPGLNIDLQTATPDKIVTFFNQDFQAIL